ncbi:hypothetical protein BRDCF_p1674 [Bacteroidales bacterium CF]|nr:hypothetical protein BRDCF_p1674 [Bacteroidales bacterium CF]
MRTLIFYVLLLFIFGCVPKSDKNEPIDRNLKSNAQEFMDSKLNYDFDKVTIFAHPIFWEITKLKFPEENNLNAIKQILKEKYVSAGIQQMNADLNMKINIGNIIDSISNNNDEYIFLIDYERTGENKFDKIYAKSIIVAITKDKGYSWKFIDIDKDFLPQTKELLTAIYPAILVDSIFNTIDNELKISTIETRFAPTDDSEINFLNQFNTYGKAFYNGNINESVNFIYPDIFEYLYDKLQGKYSINEIKSSYIEELYKQFSSESKFEFRISKILNKVKYQNSLIYAVSYHLKRGNQNDYTLVGGEMIAISADNGKKWKFMERNQEFTIPVLSKKYPDRVISEILNYEYEK